MPPRRDISDLDDGGIDRYDLRHRDDGSIVRICITATKELPAVVVRVVRNMKNRFAVEDNRT